MTSQKMHEAIEFHRSGNLAEAQRRYRAILKSEPRNFDCLYRLGILMAQASKFDQAVKWFKKALEVQPDFAEGHFNLGTLYGELGDFALAAASLERAIALDPDYAEAHHNLGNALDELGREEAALAAFDRVIDLAPTLVSAHFNRGNLLNKLRRFDAAIESYRRVLALDSDHVQTLYNCANALSELRRFPEAAEMFTRAIAIKPDYVDARFNLADVQVRLNQWDDAKDSYARVVEIDPDYEFGLGGGLWVAVNCCDWDAVEKYTPAIIEKVRAGDPVIEPFSFLAVSESPEDQLSCAQTWIRTKFPPSSSPIWRGERYRHDKIRIAYVSADFHHHPMAFLMSGVFEQHDRDAFEITAIALDPHEPSLQRKRLENAFDRFVVADQMSDREVAQKIRELEIDIAIDRKGLTYESRPAIFAHRPSPIQVNYLAYPGTMGASYIDYIIADRHVIPEGDEKFYGEEVVRLPDTYQANDARRPIGDATPSRAAVGLPQTGFVFCSFNNSYKITRQIFEIWMELLHEVDGSVLWLHEKNEPMVRNLKTAAECQGIAPTRLVFAGSLENPYHLARLRLADLSLDTPIYGAHTTASDSLFAGVPIICCPGGTFAGRVTTSLLHAIGLPELIVETPDDYRALAMRIAREPAFLAGLKAKLAKNLRTEALFDTERFTRHLETAYKTMWERHQRGQPPQAFDVGT